MYSVKTRQGQPARLTISSKYSLTGYTFTVQTAEEEAFTTTFERGQATLIGDRVVVDWSAAEVDEMTDRYFRIQATKSGSPTFYLARGQIEYTPALAEVTAGNIDPSGYLVEPYTVGLLATTRLANSSDITAIAESLNSHYRRFRGVGTTYPAEAVDGDTIYRSDLSCMMIRVNGTWRQLDKPQLANRAAIEALPAGGLYNGFEAWQTDLNRQWRYNGTKWVFVGGNIPAISVRRTTAANYAVNQWGVYNYEAVITSDTTDTTLWTATNTSRFYAPFDGLYQLQAAVAFSAAITGNRYCGARKNADMNTLRRSQSLLGNSAPEMVVDVTFKLNQGEFCEVMYYTGVTNDNVAAFGTEQTPRADFRWVGAA